VSWKIVALADVSDVFNGKTPSKDDQRDVGHPVLKIKDVSENGFFKGDFESFVDSELAKKFSGKYLELDDSLILNAAHNSDYVGSKQYRAEQAVVGSLPTGEWLIARANKDRLHPRFLNYWLQSPQARFQIKQLVKGIHLYPKDVMRLEIPLPPLPEQKRIAAILDKADAIRRKRQQAIQLADDFLRSVFLDMFGDPVTNPKGLDITSIGKLCDVATGATPPRGGDEYYGGDIPWVKTGEVDGYVIYKTEENITSKALSISNCKLNPVGSIVMAMYGQGKTRGKVGVLGVEAATNQACAVIKPSSKIMMEYLYFYLKISYEALRSLGQGAGQPYLNLSIVKGFPVPLPSEIDQMRFVKVCESVGNFSKRSSSATQDSSEFFKALSQKAFSGQL
jgi:type I restriction enzyme S subunit